MNKQTATGFVLLKVDYDPLQYDLAGITAKFEASARLTLTVCQTHDVSEIKGEHPFIAY